MPAIFRQCAASDPLVELSLSLCPAGKRHRLRADHVGPRSPFTAKNSKSRLGTPDNPDALHGVCSARRLYKRRIDHGHFRQSNYPLIPPALDFICNNICVAHHFVLDLGHKCRKLGTAASRRIRRRWGVFQPPTLCIPCCLSSYPACMHASGM